MNVIAILDTNLALDTTYDTQQIVNFFSIANLKSLMNQFGEAGIKLIAKIVFAYIIWRLGKYLIHWVLGIASKALGRSQMDVGVIKFLNSISKYSLYTLLVIIVIGILGFEVGSLVTVFSSAALAIGISLQGSLSNFAGGILILIFRPFKVGDYIISGTYEGTVISVEILYTRLRASDNKIVIIPNGTLSNTSIVNVTGIDEFRRLDIVVGISYNADVNQAKQHLTDILQAQPDVVQERGFTVIIKDLAEDCVKLETQAWVKNGDYLSAKSALLEQYKNVFDKNGIEMPYRQLDVHIHQDKEEIA